MIDAAMRVADLRAAFAGRFGRPAAVVARAPGRVNLIGEHTDYNDGLVLPIALEQSTWAVAAARDDGVARAFSTALGDERSWPVLAWRPARERDWSAYVAGVEALLAGHGAPLSGFDLLIDSDVPVGGGLSSSAALEISAALALATLSGKRLEPVELADLCRTAEHRFAGVPCGIMDQYVSVLAQPDAALLLDCRSRTWRQVPFDLGSHAIAVIDSGAVHQLAAGEYATRREQCAEATRRLAAVDPGVHALRDVSLDMLRRHAGQLPPIIAARARHVVTEIERVRQAAEALEAGNVARLGTLLAASHRSLRDDFQVSTPRIDRLVEIAANTPGVIGARLTGAGFGGCIVAIARADALGELARRVRGAAAEAGAPPARVFAGRPGGGARVLYCAP